MILLSIVIFACLTFSINREKLTNRYHMIMVKNRGLRSAVNKTLDKLQTLCGRYDSCVKYVRKINDDTDVKATPKPSTADANICCQLDTPLCKACHEGISVDEYLKKQKPLFKKEKKNDQPLRIMIAIPIHNRIGYTKFHARTLREYHKIPSDELFIFDDCSTQYGEKELREWYGNDIHFFPCKKNLGSNKNIRRMFEHFITTDYDLIFAVDTDLIFHKNWREFVSKHIDSTHGVMSLYHSNAPHHKTFNCNTELCEKRSMGSAGTVMKRSVVEEMLPANKNELFDWGFSEVFQKKKIKMVIPRKSLIMHYGQIGVNNHCGTSEVAKDFDRTILPGWINDGLTFYFDKCNKPTSFFDKKKLKNNFEVGIKTMNRYKETIRQVKSIRKIYPSVHIYIADDGKEDQSDKYKEENNVFYKKMTFDSGLSAGRNVLVTWMTSKYVVIMDDDMIWKKEFDVERGITILKKTKKKILTGGTTDRGMYSGIIYKKKSVFHICPGAKKNKEYPECVDTDIGLNIIIANRAFLVDNKWDETLKVGEHEKFFLTLKHNKPNNVIACKSFMVKHGKAGWDENKEYSKLRLRAQKEIEKAVGTVKEHAMFDTECQRLRSTNEPQQNLNIHMVWVSPFLKGNIEPTDDVVNAIKTWKKFHPNAKVKLWGNKEVKLVFPSLIPMLEKIPLSTWISNIVRYAVVNKYGGLYVDTDVLAYKSIVPLISKFPTGFFVCELPINKLPCKTLASAVFYAPQGGLSLMSKESISGSQNVLRDIDYDNFVYTGKYRVTGPALPTKLYHKGSMKQFTILKSHSFFPCDHTDTSKCIYDNFKTDKEVYGMHMWKQRWKVSKNYKEKPFRKKTVMTLCTSEYKDRAFKLSRHLSLWGYTLYIVPIGWDPTSRERLMFHFVNKPSRPVEFKGKSNILLFKVSAIEEMLRTMPDSANLLWLDADTVVLKNPTEMISNHASKVCDISTILRDSTHIQEKLALGVVVVTNNENTRAIFKSAVDSLEGGCCSKMHKDVPWFQDQISLHNAIQQRPKTNICGLTHIEHFIGSPHGGWSKKPVDSSIFYSGRPLPKKVVEIQEKTYRPHVYCVVKVTNNLDAINTVRNTWGSNCDKLFFCASEQVDIQSNEKVEVVHVNNVRKAINKEYEDMFDKLKKCLRTIQIPKNKNIWVLKADLDTYVNIQNLKAYVKTLHPKDAFIGNRLKEPVSGTVFNSGGAGFVLSSDVVRKFVSSKNEKCMAKSNMLAVWSNQPRSKNGKFCDVRVALCLHSLEVNPQDTTDSTGAERFHPLSPSKMKSLSKDKSSWYWTHKYDKSTLYSENLVSEKSISFHRLDKAEVVKLYSDTKSVGSHVNLIDVILVSGFVNCVLKRTIDGLRRNLVNIGKIHVITLPYLTKQCEDELDVYCHDENTVLKRSDIKFRNKNGWIAHKSRTSWYYQQFLKLFAYQSISLTKQFMIWDTDNILLKRYNPIEGKKTRFIVGGWKNDFYPVTTTALTGKVPNRNDIVVHQMMIHTETLDSLMMHMCGKVKKESCVNMIVDQIPKRADSKLGFSEYNLYYTWFHSKMPNNVFIDSTIKFTRTYPGNKGNGTGEDCNITPDGNFHMFVLETKRMNEREKRFQDIYETNFWTNKESLSGPGSTLKITTTVRKCISDWIKKYNITSFGDISGDFNWQHTIPEINPRMYTGFDISEKAIELARKGHPGWNFNKLDLVKDNIGKFDAFMIRDVIQHLPIDEAVRAFNNLRKSNIRYIIVSNWRKTVKNNVVGTTYGGNNKNNVYLPPFKDVRAPLEMCDNYYGEQNMITWPIDLILIKNNVLEINSFFQTKTLVPKCQKPVILPDTTTSKMICMDNIVSGSCIVYSFGINYQWDFDDYMHDYGCTVYSFDPGMDYKPKRAERHFFEKVGLGAKTGIHNGSSTLYSGKKNYFVETVDSIMKRLGHSKVDLLRMDTEGAEFDVLSHLPYNKIGQLSLEIHMWTHSFEEWNNKLMKIPLEHLQTYQNTDRVNKKTMQEITPGVTRVYEMTFI